MYQVKAYKNGSIFGPCCVTFKCLVLVAALLLFTFGIYLFTSWVVGRSTFVLPSTASFQWSQLDSSVWIRHSEAHALYQ